MPKSSWVTVFSRLYPMPSHLYKVGLLLLMVCGITLGQNGVDWFDVKTNAKLVYMKIVGLPITLKQTNETSLIFDPMTWAWAPSSEGLTLLTYPYDYDVLSCNILNNDVLTREHFVFLDRANKDREWLTADEFKELVLQYFLGMEYGQSGTICHQFVNSSSVLPEDINKFKLMFSVLSHTDSVRYMCYNSLKLSQCYSNVNYHNRTCLRRAVHDLGRDEEHLFGGLCAWIFTMFIPLFVFYEPQESTDEREKFRPGHNPKTLRFLMSWFCNSKVCSNLFCRAAVVTVFVFFIPASDCIIHWALKLENIKLRYDTKVDVYNYYNIAFLSKGLKALSILGYVLVVLSLSILWRILLRKKKMAEYLHGFYPGFPDKVVGELKKIGYKLDDNRGHICRTSVFALVNRIIVILTPRTWVAVCGTLVGVYRVILSKGRGNFFLTFGAIICATVCTLSGFVFMAAFLVITALPLVALILSACFNSKEIIESSDLFGCCRTRVCQWICSFCATIKIPFSGKLSKYKCDRLKHLLSKSSRSLATLLALFVLVLFLYLYINLLESSVVFLFDVITYTMCRGFPLHPRKVLPLISITIVILLYVGKFWCDFSNEYSAVGLAVVSVAKEMDSERALNDDVVLHEKDLLPTNTSISNDISTQRATEADIHVVTDDALHQEDTTVELAPLHRKDACAVSQYFPLHQKDTVGEFVSNELFSYVVDKQFSVTGRCLMFLSKVSLTSLFVSFAILTLETYKPDGRMSDEAKVFAVILTGSVPQLITYLFAESDAKVVIRRAQLVQRAIISYLEENKSGNIADYNTSLWNTWTDCSSDPGLSYLKKIEKDSKTLIRSKEASYMVI